jgi:ABC-type Zn uptake system ZnuABC Zn-binding protein ZnuA
MQNFRRNFLGCLFLLIGSVGWFGLAEAQSIRVIATTPDLADITKQIGKELVDVESLT